MSITKRFTKFLSKRATKARQHLKLISRASTLVNEIDLTNHHDMLLEVKQQQISQIDFDCEKSRKFKFEGTKYRKIQRGAQGLKKLGKNCHSKYFFPFTKKKSKKKIYC